MSIDAADVALVYGKYFLFPECMWPKLLCSLLIFCLMRRSARPTHHVGRAMPTRACENDRVPQKVVDQVVVKVVGKEEGESSPAIRLATIWDCSKNTHSSRFYNSGKISNRGGERGFGFYGLKGSSALIMPHLKLPCHTLAQFRLAGSFSLSANQPHLCMQTPKRR